MKVQVHFTVSDSQETEDVIIDVGAGVTGKCVCKALQDHFGEMEEGDLPFYVEAWVSDNTGAGHYAFIFRWPKGDYNCDVLISGIVTTNLPG